MSFSLVLTFKYLKDVINFLGKTTHTKISIFCGRPTDKRYTTYIISQPCPFRHPWNIEQICETRKARDHVHNLR